LIPEDGKWQGIYGLTVYVYQLFSSSLLPASTLKMEALIVALRRESDHLLECTNIISLERQSKIS